MLFDARYLRLALLVQLVIHAEQSRLLPKRIVGPHAPCTVCDAEFDFRKEWAQVFPCRCRRAPPITPPSCRRCPPTCP